MRETKTEVKPGVWRLRAYVGTNDEGNPDEVSTTVRGGIRAADKALRNMLNEQDDKKLAPKRTGDTLGSLLARGWTTSRNEAAQQQPCASTAGWSRQRTLRNSPQRHMTLLLLTTLTGCTTS